MRVFISRGPEQNAPLRELSGEANLEWIEQALISTQSMAFTLPDPLPEWCFFSSPKAADHFFQDNPKFEAKIAVLGEGTARHIPSGRAVSFVGKGTTEETAKTFATQVEGKKVLFPIGNRSNQTVQSFLSPNQVVNLLCYETVLTPRPIPECDLYFFTSPTNVESFAEVNPFPENASYLAMGFLTAGALASYGVNAIIPENYSTEACWNAIFSRFHS